MQGHCALCKLYRELQLSHLLPKATYKNLRGDLSAPVQVKPDEKVALLSNTQIQKHLLCSECEQRFNRLGENTVLKYLASEETPSALLTLQKDQQNSTSLDALSRAFAYFALSVIWRASVTRWPEVDACYRALGPYQENFAAFLLEKADFPNNVVVDVLVNTNVNLLGVACTPTRTLIPFRGERVHRYHFLIPGLRFVVLVGGVMNTEAQQRGGKASFRKWDLRGSMVEGLILDNFSGVRRKGKLAQMRE